MSIIHPHHVQLIMANLNFTATLRAIASPAKEHMVTDRAFSNKTSYLTAVGPSGVDQQYEQGDNDCNGGSCEIVFPYRLC